VGGGGWGVAGGGRAVGGGSHGEGIYGICLCDALVSGSHTSLTSYLWEDEYFGKSLCLFRGDLKGKRRLLKTGATVLVVELGVTGPTLVMHAPERHVRLNVITTIDYPDASASLCRKIDHYEPTVFLYWSILQPSSRIPFD
jgi:hypothetical protein